MSAIQFTNQFPGELSASLTAIATTLVLKSGHGDSFPVIANGQDKYFFVTVVDKNGAREIVKIIQRASGSDTLVAGSSIADQPSGNVSGRAQEGTTAIAVTYTDDHLVELRLTAGTMQGITDGAAAHAAATGTSVHGLGTIATQAIAAVTASIIPNTDDAIDLGSSTKEFKDLYVDGTANIDAANIGALSTDVITINSIAQGKDVTAALHRKIVEIGDWDMESTQTKNVAHGITASKIRNVTGVIREDDDDTIHYSPLTPSYSTTTGAAQIVYWDDTVIVLSRQASYTYDDNSYNKTSYNRGWLIIDYVD